MATLFEDSAANGRPEGGEHGGEQGSERPVDAERDVIHRFGDRLDALAEMMKKHPLLSIWIGIGAGYLLARIIHRD